MPLAAWCGMDADEQVTVAALLTLLQVAIDVADNVADWQEDRLEALPTHKVYEGESPATLAAVPALLVGLVVHEVFSRWPSSGGDASARLLGALSSMAHGQGLADRSKEKVEAVSARQGLLLCLPLWVRQQDPEVQRRTPEVERWAVAYARTWELAEIGSSHEQLVAKAVATFCWPTWGPFAPNGPLTERRLQGRGNT
jgi:hypothetical protein